MLESKTIENVKDYYGKVLHSKDDLQTSACCTAEAMPNYLRPILSQIHEEVLDKFYGCGSPIPHQLEGLTILDLGSGTGRDAYMLSKLVGPKGRVIGIDMTDEQIAVANSHVDYHTKQFGFTEPNVEFFQGYIEDLKSLKIADSSVDIVVSNCVLNLSPAKDKVFSEIFRVLKSGGELYFSDVFSGQRVPEELAADPVIHGECLGGAMYIEDFRRLLTKVGCNDYRVFSSQPLAVESPEIFKKIGMIDFYSMTVRAFKLDLEDRCEDYGQVAYYKGSIPECPHQYILDNHHLLKTNQPFPICGNTAKMISQSRLARHFDIVGEGVQHFGLFDCAPGPQTSSTEQSGACC